MNKIILLVILILVTGCTWKSPAEHKLEKERLTIEHIHGPECEHEHRRHI